MSPVFEAAIWAAYTKWRLSSCACNFISQNPLIALQIPNKASLPTHPGTSHSHS